MSALVLNATYEALSIVSPRRAACLILDGKADLLADDGSTIHSAHLSVPTPTVIRLRYTVKVPYYRQAALSRRAVFNRDDHRCQYCGSHADSIDHIFPRSRGGKNTWENVAAACRACNLHKRDRTPEEAGMRLHRTPRQPREQAWVVSAVGRVPEDWKPYLALASLGCGILTR